MPGINIHGAPGSASGGSGGGPGQDKLYSDAAMLSDLANSGDLAASAQALKEVIKLREQEIHALMDYARAEAKYMDARRTSLQNFWRSIAIADATAMDRERTRRLNQQRGFIVGDANHLNRLFDNWQRTVDRAWRANFDHDAKAIKDTARLHDQAAREDFVRDQRRIRQKENFDRGLEVANALKEDRERTAQQRFDRARQVDLAKSMEAQRRALDPTTYTSNYIGRLGSSGGNAAAGKDYATVYRSTRSLNRLEASLQKQMGTAVGPEILAVGQKMDAVAKAKANIAGGMAMNSELENGLGMAWQGLRANPLVAGIGAVAMAIKTAVDLPFSINTLYQQAIGRAQPFIDLTYGTSAIARGGGFDQRQLLASLFPGGTTRPDYAMKFGLSPLQAMQIIGQSGIPFSNPDDAMNMLMSVGNASRSPFLGSFSMGELAQSGGLAALLGVAHAGGAGSNPADFSVSNGRGMSMDEYFAQMQRTMQVATQLGIDKSVVRQSVEGLYRQAASSGAAQINVGGINDFYARTASSGMAMFRTGEGQLSMAQGLNNATAQTGYGGAAVQIAATGRFIQRHGGLPTTEAGLARIIGADRVARLKDPSNPGGQQILADLLQAGRRGDMAGFQSVLQPVVSGDPELQTQIANEFGAEQGGGGYLGHLIGAAAGGVSYGQLVGYNSGKAGRPAAAGGNLDSLTPEQRAWVSNAAKASGLSETEVAALIASESGFNPTAQPRDANGNLRSSAYGLGQILRGTADEDTRLDPQKNANFAAQYFASFKRQYLAQGLPEWKADQMAALSYHEGHMLSIGSHITPEGMGVPSKYAAQIARFSTSTQQADQLLGTGGQVQMIAGEQGANLAYPMGGTAGAALMAVSGTAEQLTGGAIDMFSSALANATEAVKNFASGLWDPRPTTPGGGGGRGHGSSNMSVPVPPPTAR